MRIVGRLWQNKSDWFELSRDNPEFQSLIDQTAVALIVPGASKRPARAR